jgi:hypothetical protein
LLTIRRQARHRTHDALALLGWTNLGLRLTPGWWGERTPELLEELRPGAGPAEAEQLLREIRDELVHVDPVAHRETLRPVFHWEDVPDEVVAADNALATVRNGPTAFVGQLPDIAREDAATLDVPLFLGFGERDVSPDPWAEPPVYRSARDLTFHVLPRSGHCHNFASTRVLQWERIASWVRSLSPTA